MKVYLNEHFFKFHDLLEADLIEFKYSDVDKTITLTVDSKEDYLYHILKKLGDKRPALGYDYLIYKFVFLDVTKYFSTDCHNEYNENYYYTNTPSNIQLEAIEIINLQDAIECEIYFFNSFGSRKFQCQKISFEQFIILEEDGIFIDRDRETEFTFEQLK